MLMVEPASIDGNELTDKGYINQRAGLERRAALVERLYAEQPGRRRDYFELKEDRIPSFRTVRLRTDPESRDVVMSNSGFAAVARPGMTTR